MVSLLAVNWSNVWMETGIGIGIVFFILVLLVFVLQIFNFVASKGTKEAAPAKIHTLTETEFVSATPDNDKVAIATALYLYYQDVHDEESHVITIHHNDHTAWHHELNQQI